MKKLFIAASLLAALYSVAAFNAVDHGKNTLGAAHSRTEAAIDAASK